MVLELVHFVAAIQRIEGYDRVLFKWWYVALPIAALMIALAIWKATVILVAWVRKPSDCPNKLFRRLAKLHRLNREELELLTVLSETLPSDVPGSVLFVEPTSWAWNQEPIANKVDLGEKLFAKIFGFPPERLACK
jgi:hypothetical protein